MLALAPVMIFVKIALAALGIGYIIERFASHFLSSFLVGPPSMQRVLSSWRSRLQR